MIFDCHVHIEQGLENYDLNLTSRRNIIFNEVESYQLHHKNVPQGDAISLILSLVADEQEFVLEKAQSGKIQALKILTRDQKLTLSDHPVLSEMLKRTPSDLPVIYDAFYFGDEMKYQPSLEGLIYLANSFPERKFIVAHSGGIELLRYFFHLRKLPNILYDLSFSLQYLADSSIFKDLIKLIRFTPPEKIMFGSDYYFASAKKQYDVLQTIFDEVAFTEQMQQMVLFDNAKQLFFPE